MLRHLFLLIWNKKKQNFLLMSEMLVSFLVVFGVFSTMVYYYQNYRKPLGMEPDHVWVINYNSGLQTSNKDSLQVFYETLRQSLKAMPQIREVTYTSANFPFSQTTNSTGLRMNGRIIERVNFFQAETDYKAVLGIKVLEGRWFNRGDAVAKDKPIVINESLKKTAFGNGRAAGQYLSDWSGEKRMKVIGVVQDTKTRGDYTDIGHAMFARIDTSDYGGVRTMLVKVTPDADAAFEGRLYRFMAGTLKNANIEIGHLPDLRRAKNKDFLTPLFIIVMVVGFLVINVALGLFGVLWYNINRRKGEIGLRRAVGASGGAISRQLVGETMVLATLSLIAGSFFAVQFPVLRIGNIEAGVYLTAIGLAALFIYVLVLVCSLYPGRQAAAIYPAVALHED